MTYKGFDIVTLTDATETVWIEIVDLRTSCVCCKLGPFGTYSEATEAAETWCDKARATPEDR